VIVIVSAIAELERSLIVERVRAGMRRAKLEGRRIGRKPLEANRSEIRKDRQLGYSLKKIAKLHGISKTSVARVLKEPVPQGCAPAGAQATENKRREVAA
jgi:DNA invertase Pin-like site-specific DNA recombinase